MKRKKQAFVGVVGPPFKDVVFIKICRSISLTQQKKNAIIHWLYVQNFGYNKNVREPDQLKQLLANKIFIEKTAKN